MLISKRKYYRNFLFAMTVISALIFIGALFANKYFYHLDIVNKICKFALIGEIIIIAVVWLIILLKNKGIKNYISKMIILGSIESNLISIGAYTKLENKNFVELPKIKINKDKVIISLSNLKIRAVIERYLDSFSTALPERYIVEDYYITQNNSEVIILFEDIKTFKYEKYSIEKYKNLVESMNTLDLYFDRKHIVSVNDYPHFFDKRL